MKNNFARTFIFLLSFLFCCLNVFADDDNKTVVTINGSDFTEYRHNKEKDCEEIIFSGNVSISVKKGESETTINADSIIYNRSADMLYANGNIKLVQKSSSAGEQTITASTLMFNTSTLEGIFDGGRAVQTQSDAINLPSDATLIVASEIFGRSSSNTITFKNAELTFCDDENPHWKIKASRIWLLPGGEFAFFNAVVKIGSVPVMYLPVFYYPKDELIFNPSVGYDQRLGYYFQTTTYLMGRKPLSESKTDEDDDNITKGLFNFMKPSVLKEQKREGLVLHNTDKDFKGDTSNFLKLIADYYSNAGYLLGINGTFKPKNEYVSDFSTDLNIAFSNTIFSNNGGYSTYSSDGKEYTDSGNFFGKTLPFRFGGKIKFALNKPFSFSLDMPFYSDPFFESDYKNRSEYMDWISYFMDSGGSTDDDTSQISSYTWDAKASYNFSVPDSVKPYVSSLSISEFNSSVLFSSKSRSGTEWESKNTYSWRSATPERMFYYPSQVVPVKVSAKVSGTIFQWPPVENKTSDSCIEFPFELKSPFENEQKKSDSIAENEKNSWLDENILFNEFDISSSVTPRKISGTNYSLSYSVSPSYSSQLNYDGGDDLKNPTDFSWSNISSSYHQFTSPVNLNSNLTFRDSFVSLSNGFTFVPYIQSHPNLSGYTDDSSKASVKKIDYEAKKMNLENTNNVSFKPFIYSEIWGSSSIVWNTSLKLIRTKFLGDLDDPQWEYEAPDFTDEDCVTSHTLTANLAATEGSFSQTLSLRTTLPPQKDAYNGTLTFGFPNASVAFSTGLEQKSKDDEDFKWNPFQQTASIKLFDNALSFTQSFNYEIEDNYFDSLKFSLTWKNLQASYVMQYSDVYDATYTDGCFSGWESTGEKKFQPYSFSISYVTSSNTFRYWKNRVVWQPNLNTSIVYDCLRPTNSYFRFVPSVTFKVHEAVEFTFSAESENHSIFRYFQKYAGYEDALSGETNVLKDLYNSFKFWDDEHFYDPDQKARKESGFKLKSLNLTVKRNLHDWDFCGTIKFSPRIVEKKSGTEIKKEYDYKPYLTFSISWHPMASIRTEVVDEYGKWQLNP